jgi:basic amino acid/polyamine antiporter, APA family
MKLERALGLGSLTFYGVGIILGAGIYSVIGAAAAKSGDALWQAFLIGGVVAFLTALAYAELATSYPRAAAEFTYLKKAFPKWPALATSTGLLVALSGAATAATVAISFASYLDAFIEVPAVIVALALLAIMAGLNIVGVKASGWVNAAFTILEAGGLVLFVGVGATTPEFGDAMLAAPNAGVLSGAALVFFAFLGFENIANLAEEAKDPTRDLPRAIFLSLAVSTLLYVAVALAASALSSPESLAASGAPLTDAARSQSRSIAGALGGIALFATANTALVSILVASRVVFGMARDRHLPEWMAKILPSRKTPWPAILVVSAVAAALVPFGKVGVVASVSSFAALVAFFVVNVALIVLRYKAPGVKRPFKVPGSIGKLPIIPIFAALCCVLVAARLEPTALITGTVLLAVFSVFGVVQARRAA